MAAITAARPTDATTRLIMGGSFALLPSVHKARLGAYYTAERPVGKVQSRTALTPESSYFLLSKLKGSIFHAQNWRVARRCPHCRRRRAGHAWRAIAFEHVGQHERHARSEAVHHLDRVRRRS